VIGLCSFLEALWLSLKFLQWDDTDKIIEMAERLAKVTTRILASLLKSLPDIASKLNSPNDLSKIERRFFVLYIVHVSPIDFMDRSLKFNSIVNKLNKPILTKLLSPFMTKKPLRNVLRVDEILLITQEKEVLLRSEINPLLAKLMAQLHEYAISDLQIHNHWINHFVRTLDLERISKEKVLSVKNSRIGWASYNTCIFVLEVFSSPKDISELREKLMIAFVEWSHKTLNLLIDLLQEPSKVRAEIVNNTYNSYMLPVFTFYSYLSRNNPKFSIMGTKLSIEIIERLMKSKLMNFLTQKNAESILGSLYFLFSFMCKQIKKHKEEKNKELLEIKDHNCILLGLKLFKYITRCMKESSKEDVEEEDYEPENEKDGTPISIKALEDKLIKGQCSESELLEIREKLKKFKKDFDAGDDGSKLRGKTEEPEEKKEPKTKPKEIKVKKKMKYKDVNEAIESLEVIALMIGSLIRNVKVDSIPLINDWILNSEAIHLILSIIDISKKVAGSGVNGIIGRLIIEVTNKDACYNVETWKKIVSAIPEYLSKNRRGINCYMFAFILKLNLCCSHKFAGMRPEEVKELTSLWWNVIHSLILKHVEERQKQNKELAILFLMQTILKKDNEALFADSFIKALSKEKGLSAEYYQLFIRITGTMQAEDEIMKACSESMNLILLRGIAPKPVEFKEINTIDAINKLMNLLQTKELKSELLELYSFISLSSTQPCTPLFNEVLAYPELIRFEEESKKLSPNYYLQSLLNLMHSKDATEQVQENILALIQSYCEADNSGNLPRLIYMQSVLNAYIVFVGYLIEQKVALPSLQDILGFVHMAFDRTVEIVFNLLEDYYKSLLSSKEELTPFSESLANISIMSPDLKESLERLKLSELYSEYFKKDKDRSQMTGLLNNIRKNFRDLMKDPSKSHEAISQILNAHFSSKFDDGLALKNYEKALNSCGILTQSLIHFAIPLFKEGDLATTATLRILSQMKDLAFSGEDEKELNDANIEICKAANIDSPIEVQKAICGLLVLKRFNKALVDLLQVSNQIPDKELLKKAIEILLEGWEACGKKVEKINIDIITSAGELIDYDFSESIKSTASLLESKDLSKDAFIQIITAIYNIIPRKPEYIKITQAQLLKLPNDFLQSLLSIKERNMHKILSDLMKDSSEIQQKLFIILIDILLATQTENITSDLDLLTEIIEGSRELYIPSLIDKLLPFIQSSKNYELQATLLTYLASICYLGMSVKYPIISVKDQNNNEPTESLIEGYNTTNYVKQAEVGGLNICSMYMRGRRKSDSQPCYYCYTCNLVDTKACCSVCARVCHKGHKIMFASNAQSNCSCQSEWECQATAKGLSFGSSESGLSSYISHYKKLAMTGRTSELIEEKLLLISKHLADTGPKNREPEPRSQEEEEDDVSSFTDDLIIEDKSHSEDASAIFLASNKSDGQLSASEKSFDDKSPIPLPPRNIPYEKSNTGIPEIEAKFKLDKKEAEYTLTILSSLCKLLLNEKVSIVSKLFSQALKKERKTKYSSEKLLGGKERFILNASTLAQLKQVFDLTLNTSNNFRKSLHTITSDLTSSFETYVSLFPAARNSLAKSNTGLMAIAYKETLSIHNSNALLSEASGSRAYISDKRKVPSLFRFNLGFMICSLHFNEANESYLAITGIRDCMVFTLNTSGQLMSQLKINLMLEDMGDNFTVTKAFWIPKSQVHLAVAINSFVRIYDLSRNNISPIYVLHSSQTVIKDMCVTKNEDLNFYRFFLLSGNTVITHVLEIPPVNRSESDDAEVHAVEVIHFAENIKTIINSTNIMSICRGSISGLLYLTLGNGKVIYGEFDEETLELKSASTLRTGDSNSSKHFFALQEISVLENEILLCGMLMAVQPQGVLIKICEKEAYYHVLRQKIESCFFLTSKNVNRILTLSEGFLGSYLPAITSHSKSTQSSIKANDYAKFIEISHLPQTVSLPVDYLEKATNILNTTTNLAKKVKIGGSIGLLVGNDAVALLEWLILARGNNQFPVGAPSASVELALTDASEYVIVGIRILADTAPKQYIHIFNRRVQLGTVAKNITEIGFCDAEILSIEDNNISFVLTAEDSPIKLKGIEVYVLNKSDFEFNQKIENLAQMVEKKFNTKASETGEFASILSTNAYTILPWNQKEKLLNETIKEQDGLKTIISCLDFLSSVAYLSTPLSTEVAEEILTALEPFIYLSTEGKAALRAFETAVRKCAKAIIYNVNQGKEQVENDKFHYLTYKTKALFKRLNELLKESPRLEVLEIYVKSMAAIVIKAKLCFFERMVNDSSVLYKLNGILFNAIEKAIASDIETDLKTKVKRVMENYIIIMMGYYDLLLNIEYKQNESKLSPHTLMNPTNIGKMSKLIEPYLFGKMIEIKQVFVSVLSEVLPKRDLDYIHTYQTPIIKKCKWNVFFPRSGIMEVDQPLELEIRVFDFSFALGIILRDSFDSTLSENTKAHIPFFILLKELLCNYSSMASHLRSVEEKSDEDWSSVFRSFVDCILTKKSVTNFLDHEAILIGLKLLNNLLPNPKAKDSKKNKVLELETAFKFLAYSYQQTNLISWTTSSLKSLFVSLKEKREALEPMEDIGIKEELLRVKPKFTKDLHQSSFMGEDIAYEDIKFIIFQELFKLCYNMAACEQKAIRKGMEGRSLFRNSTEIEALKDLLCEASITTKISSGLDSSARSLLRMLYKSKNELNQYKDNFTYSLGCKTLRNFINSKEEATYEVQATIYNQLNAVWKVAKERTIYWKSYVKSNPDMIKMLFAIAGVLSSRITFQALALICLALENIDSDTFNIKYSYEALLQHTTRTIDILESVKYVPIAGDKVGEGIADTEIFKKGLELGNNLLLDSGSLRLRTIAAHLLKGLWDSGNTQQREEVFKLVAQKITPDIHRYGCTALQLLSLCLFMFQNEELSNTEYSEIVLGNVIKGSKLASDVIRKSELAEVYREVQGMISGQDREGDSASSRNEPFLYCLQEMPCSVCMSDIGQEYTMQKITDIKEECGYISSSYIYRLANSYSIQKIAIHVEHGELKPIKALNFYSSSIKDASLSTLKENILLWKKIGTLTFKHKSRNGVLELPITITTNLLKMEFIPGPPENPM